MKQLITAIILFIFTAACNVTRRLPEGEKLYTGATIKVENKDLKKSRKKAIINDLETFVKPKPNSKILGARFKLWVYQVAGKPKKNKGLKYWLRNKMGEPPVLASTVNLPQNVEVMTNRLENKGYFQAQVSGDTIGKHKKVHAIYVARPHIQYTIRKIVIPSDTSSVIEKLISESTERSLLRPGNPYDLDVIIAERERLDIFLKRSGFYYFNPDYFLMRVDSSIGEHKVDIFVTFKPETPGKALKRYYINDIFLYPNYTIDSDTAFNRKNVTRYKDFYVIDSTHKFKPQVFDRAMLFHKGEIYNVADHNLSLNRLVNIGTFKFVKNRFEPRISIDTARLDAFYYLTPQKGKTIRTELTAKTNTAGFAGTEFELSWRNRNTFRGAELLTIKANTGFDFQVTGQNKGYNIFRIGGEMNLVWPRIFPIYFRSASAFVPRSNLLLGYDWQNRQRLYTLNTFRAGFGYLWRESDKKEHDFKIFNVTYVNSTRVSQEYLDKIQQDSTLARVIEKQFIIGPTYSYTYTNTTRPGRKNGIFYNGKLDLSANLLGLLQGANALENNYKSFLGVRYSQYIKTEHDFRYYVRLDANRANIWANRLYIGAGFPYGNSLQMPFIKQFFSGGTNSLRGFRARSIGPGTYRPNVGVNDFLPDQTGDIKLEINSELRFKLFSIVHAGLFVDAGNIWLKKEDKLKPGARFSNNFLKELAADAGIGLRFDLNILLLRTDFAFPIRKPWLPEGQRMVIDQVDFSSKAWRKENIVFNLAIGLPF